MKLSQQCSIPGMDPASSFVEDLRNASQLSSGYHNDFLRQDILQPNIQSIHGTSLEIQPSVDHDICRRYLMSFQNDRQYELPSFSSGPLALSLNCHISPSSTNNPSQSRQTEGVLENTSAHFRELDRCATENCTHSQESSVCDRGSCFTKSTSMASIGPLQNSGYLHPLQNSRYLRPTQQLLDELVCVSNLVESDSYNSFKTNRASGRSRVNGGGAIPLEKNSVKGCSFKGKDKQNTKNTKLTVLLHELERQYEKYWQQMDGVISSFEAVAGVGAAKSYIALTIQAMSLHFSNLQDAIISQLQASSTLPLDPRTKNRCILQSDSSNQNKTEMIGKSPNLGMIPPRQAWRNFRGLPDNSVTILRTWLFEHFLHPYPNDSEKLMLSSQTGLSRNQISNWFINARVRLWKPMIEEMYKEEFEDPSETNRS